jgi:uncharacterized protein (TIRG00374 family)
MASAHCETETPKATQPITAGKVLDSGALRGIGFGKLLAGGLGFFLLTVGIFWYQFHRIQVADETPRWSQLQWGYFILILLCLPLETVASGLRVWLICRVLQPGVGLWTCFKAEWANVAIAMLTPSQSGGGPGEIYLLSRGGASVGTALTVCLLSFVGTMVGLLCMGLYSLLVSGLAHASPLFAAATWTIVSISAAMVLAALWPGFFRSVFVAVSQTVSRIHGIRPHSRDCRLRGDPGMSSSRERLDRLTAKLVDIIYTYRDDMWRFLCHGKAALAWVCLLSLIFLSSRALMPYLCLRFLGINTSTFRQVIEAQVALIFLVFFAPTPGGAGVAEAASLSIMEDIVPIGFAPYYALLWRSLTLYLTAIAGLFCLVHALSQDARQVIRRMR